jgi:hypothetical protein
MSFKEFVKFLHGKRMSKLRKQLNYETKKGQKARAKKVRKEALKRNKEYLQSLKSRKTTKRSNYTSGTGRTRKSGLSTGRSGFTDQRSGYSSDEDNQPPKSQRMNTTLDTACVLTEDDIFAMQEIFDKLDVHEDLILPRKKFVSALREDIRVIKLLHKPAIYMSKVDRHMNLDRLLQQIAQEADIDNEVVRKTKEFISWNQFISYFEDYNRLPSSNPEKVDILDRRKKFRLSSHFQLQRQRGGHRRGSEDPRYREGGVRQDLSPRERGLRRREEIRRRAQALKVLLQDQGPAG